MSPRVRYFFLILALVAAAVCIRLGLWQRTRLRERRAANAQLEAARQEPPVNLSSADRGSLVNRRVIVRGTYDHEHDQLLRNQASQERPGVNVITPLRMPGTDTAVLVNRGFVPAPDGLTAPALDSLREAGEQDVEGVAFALGAAPKGGEPLERGGHVAWRALDSVALAARLPYPVLNVVILQSPKPTLPNYPRRLDPRPLDDGPHWSYMMQWFAFAIIFAGGGVMVALGRRVPEWSEPTAPVPSAAGRPQPPPA